MTMKLLQPATNVPLNEGQIEAMVAFGIKHGQTRQQVLDEIDRLTKAEVWKNDLYTVQVRLRGTGIVHLSIKRNDRSACKDWRHFQQIKNQLVGPECEGVELYPAESRLVDSANQYHLWVYEDPEGRIPIGWNSGRLVDGESTGGATQRPIDEILPLDSQDAR